MSWNEPGDNKNKPQQEPPDLDEALRNLKRKLRGLFSGNGRAARGSSDAGGGGSIAISLILFLVLFVWLLSGIFIVRPAEKAVILRFGRHTATVDPGPHWIPRFISTKSIVDVNKVYTFSSSALMLTQDENIVSVAVAVHYRIEDPFNYLFNVVNPQETLKQATASAVRQVVGHTSLDNILTVGRGVVRQQIFEQLTKTLKIYQAGLMISDVAIQPAKPPEEVKEAFDDAIKAQEDEQRFINQAQAYQRGVVPIAEGQAKRITQEAYAFKQQEILEAKGNVARFLALVPEYLRAPAITRERLYLDAVESVLSKTSKVLINVQGSNNLLYLPLDKIIGQGTTMRNMLHLAPGGISKTQIESSEQHVDNKSQTRRFPERMTREEFLSQGRY